VMSLYSRSGPNNPADAMVRADSIGRQAARFNKAAPEKYVLLKEIEWTGHNVHLSLVDLCPVCENHVQCGHSPDCKLAAVLKAVEGE
jgi:hypothetical protein